MSWFASHARLAGLVFLLAACAKEPAPAVVEAEAAPEPQAVSEAAPETALEPAIETGAAVPVLAALPPEPVIDDDPQQLYGLDAAALDDLLGQPDLIRTEAPAQIWQYRSETCVFDIFLYEEAGRSLVSYIEARDGAAEQIEARTCLNELLRARMGLPLS